MPGLFIYMRNGVRAGAPMAGRRKYFSSGGKALNNEVGNAHNSHRLRSAETGGLITQRAVPRLAYVYLPSTVMCFKKMQVAQGIYGFFIGCFAFSMAYHIPTYHCALPSSPLDYFQFMPLDFVTLAENFKTFYSRLILFFSPLRFIYYL